MTKKSIFNGLVRIEFENGKNTEVACLSMPESVIEIRHDSENPENRHNTIESDSLSVRASERLVLVVSESYARTGEINEDELAEVWKLYRKARRHSEDRLRVRIYSENGDLVGYAWIGEGKGVAEGDTTDTEGAEGGDTEDTEDEGLEGFAFISIVIPCGRYSTESNKSAEPRIADISVEGKDYEIVGTIKCVNPKICDTDFEFTQDCLTDALIKFLNQREKK